MKKCFFLIMVALTVFCALPQKAEAQTPIRLSYTARADSIVTSSSADTSTKIISITANYGALGIGINVGKVSGTVNAKAYLSGSIDGTNYFLLDSTASFSNASASYKFVVATDSNPYYKYKIQVIAPSSTQRLGIGVWYLPQRRQ